MAGGTAYLAHAVGRTCVLSFHSYAVPPPTPSPLPPPVIQPTDKVPCAVHQHLVMSLNRFVTRTTVPGVHAYFRGLRAYRVLPAAFPTFHTLLYMLGGPLDGGEPLPAHGALTRCHQFTYWVPTSVCVDLMYRDSLSAAHERTGCTFSINVRTPYSSILGVGLLLYHPALSTVFVLVSVHLTFSRPAFPCPCFPSWL